AVVAGGTSANGMLQVVALRAPEMNSGSSASRHRISFMVRAPPDLVTPVGHDIFIGSRASGSGRMKISVPCERTKSTIGVSSQAGHKKTRQRRVVGGVAGKEKARARRASHGCRNELGRPV